MPQYAHPPSRPALPNSPLDPFARSALPIDRCPANMARTRQSRLKSCRGFQVKVIKPCKFLLFSITSGTEMQTWADKAVLEAVGSKGS